METNSRWERGTLNFIPPRKIGKRPRAAGSKHVDQHYIDKTSGVRLTWKQVQLNFKFGLEKMMRRRFLHVTKGYRTRSAT